VGEEEKNNSSSRSGEESPGLQVKVGEGLWSRVAAEGWDGDLGRDRSGGKHEDQPKMRGTFMAREGVVRKEQVGGRAELQEKGEQGGTLLQGAGAQRGAGM